MLYGIQALRMLKSLKKGNDNMNIKTKYHGEISINEEEILYFEKGIPGFRNEAEFVQIPLTEDGLFQFTIDQQPRNRLHYNRPIFLQERL